MSVRNPWITEPEDAAAAQEAAERPPAGAGEDLSPHARGSRWPQRGIPEVDVADRLARHPVTHRGPWVLGVHGGSGESTLAAWLDARPAGHAWPISNEQPAAVLLVARTHARGLLAARRAATEWASGSVRVKVIGLVLMADAPGRLPPALRDQIRQLSGAVPATWTISFLPALRTDATPSASPPPQVTRTLRSIQQHTPKEET